MKKALDTISETPLLLAIPIVTACIIAVILTLDGQITVEAIGRLLLTFGSGVVTGGAVARPSKKLPKPETKP